MIKWNRGRAGLLLCLVLSLGGVGCGSTSDDKDNGGSIEPGASTKKMVTAAEGGEVSLGAITADIPAGALADDTEITVEALDKDAQPGASSIVADVFDFGPDGTEFLKPVTLTFDVEGLVVPKDKDAKMAFLRDGKWVTLDDSALSGGKVTATTTHFTPFTIVLVLKDDGTIGQVGGECPTDDFDACGGDLAGTWKFTASCATLAPGQLLGGSDDNNPFKMCTAKPTAAITVDLEGTVSFNEDKSFAVDQSITFSAEFRIPGACIEQLAMGQGTVAQFCEQFEGTVKDGDCAASFGPETQEENSTGTWSTEEGGVLTITDSEEAGGVDAGGGTDAPTSAKYCVKGNQVTVVMDTEEGMKIHYTAERQ